MLVVPSRAWQDINEKQLSALEEWISRGGHLVAAGGINYGSLSDKRLSKLAALEYLRHQGGWERELIRFDHRVKLSDRNPVLLLDAALDSAQVKVREQNIPVISQKPFGRGSVFFWPLILRHPLSGNGAVGRDYGPIFSPQPGKSRHPFSIPLMRRFIT
jgi:hypothetical protein